MDNITLPAWVGKALYAVGVAAVLGGGSTVLNTTRDVAVLQSQQERTEQYLERIDGKLDRLIEKDSR